MRESRSALGVIRDAAGECILLRWSPHWQEFSVFGGHIEDGETPESCLRREAVEELERELTWVGPEIAVLRFEAVSKRSGTRTRYEAHVLPTRIADLAALSQTTGDQENLMASPDEIMGQRTLDGRPISDMTRRVLLAMLAGE